MSTNELIVAYVAQRARLKILIPLSVAISAAAWTGVGLRTSLLPEFVAVVAQTLVLVLAFRVWDDIEDRTRDAVEHPERVLASSGRIAPFIYFAVALGAAAMIPALFVARAFQQLAMINIAIVILIAWYQLRPSDAPSVVNSHVVLMKYPLIALVVAPLRPHGTSLLALYFGLCVYETFDDPVLRASPRARQIAITELVVGSIALAAEILFGGKLL